MSQDGIIPNSGFNRYTVNFNGANKFLNGLNVSSSINYSKSIQEGSPQGNGGSFAGQLSRIPRSFDLMGRPYKDALGRSIYYTTTQNHPLWSTDYETTRSENDRVFGNFKIDYNIAPWLNVAYRVSGDTYIDRRNIKYEIGSNRNPTGLILVDNFYRSELNGDLMITASKDNLFLDDLSVSGLLGQNINQRVTNNSLLSSSGLSVRGFDNPNNGSVFSGSGAVSTKRRLIGYYGQLNLSYKNYAFIELTGRADQSSTLPAENNIYFYPGISASFVPTEAFSMESNILSYVKVRGSFAKVGRDADPYSLTSVFTRTTLGNNVAGVVFPLSVGGASLPGFRPGATIGSSELTPEFVVSREVGLNVGLFRNRASIDAAYFYTKSENQIFDVSISTSSGYSFRTTNVGLMVNQGLELVLNATPVKMSNFQWDITVNFTRIRNVVKEIAPGVESSRIGGNAFGGIFPSIKVGEPYGVFLTNQLPKNENGDRLINPTTGLYAPAVAGVATGNPQPDWLGGVMNTLSFKGLSLSVLFDTRQGGDVFSFTAADVIGQGHLDITGVDRDQPRILEGVIAQTGGNGETIYVPNNIQIPAQTYWGAKGGLGSEANIFKATVYRLRELSLNYTLPQNLISKTPFGSVSIGFSGNNLWFFAPFSPIDPEVNTQGAGNIQGFDFSGAPNTRNYGFNLRVTL